MFEEMQNETEGRGVVPFAVLAFPNMRWLEKTLSLSKTHKAIID